MANNCWIDLHNIDYTPTDFMSIYNDISAAQQGWRPAIPHKAINKELVDSLHGENTTFRPPGKIDEPSFTLSVTNFKDHPLVTAISDQLLPIVSENDASLHYPMAVRFLKINPNSVLIPHRHPVWNNLQINFPLFGDFKNSPISFYKFPEHYSTLSSIVDQEKAVADNTGPDALDGCVAYTNPIIFNPSKPHGVVNQCKQTRVVLSFMYEDKFNSGDNLFYRIKDRIQG